MIPTDSDIAALPHFRRDQLMLTKFLGSGAFGEVFEGVAKNILDDNSGKTKVAVKVSDFLIIKVSSSQQVQHTSVFWGFIVILKAIGRIY